MRLSFVAIVIALSLAPNAWAKPAHLKALADYVGPSIPKAVNNCRTCHLPDSADDGDKPHNVFGKRIAEWRKARRAADQSNDIAGALDALVDEDADKDGVANLVEILTGHLPGDPNDTPALAERAEGTKKLVALCAARADYAWQPFLQVKRPALPAARGNSWVRNPIDAFVAEQHEKQGLKPRPEATKAMLLRRVYLDLIGLPPTRDELHAFLADSSTDAYEKVVDRLLRSPQYGEAQARHWMDVWHYSDWAGFGNEVRDSQPHIWRWRDWIVESLNADVGYDRMVKEMLAGDEIAPDNANTIRATGFLVRNWYKFSREVWLDRIVEHTSKAFLGVTLNCAKCHDHMYDPIPQTDFYAFRAIFQPHDIRIDRVPGQADMQKDGLVHVYDANLVAPTYLFVRGNDKEPDTSKPIPPSVPAALRGAAFDIKPVSLPADAFAPDKRDFVVQETIAANDVAVHFATEAIPLTRARVGTVLLGSNPWTVVGRCAEMQLYSDQRNNAENDRRLAELKRDVFDAVIVAERIDSKTQSEEWKRAATKSNRLQRELAVAEAKKAVLKAILAPQKQDAKSKADQAKQLADLEVTLTKAEAALKQPPATTFSPNPGKTYPPTSSGRRLALANWIADAKNPLTARVAVNHLWLRRFGTGLVPSVFDFGKNGRPPTHPKLLDWLAAELMERRWSLKEIHRLMVTSATYRMDTANDASNAARDADNRYLWRMNPRRMSAEAVRDSVLFVAGELNLSAGGPEIDHYAGMTIKRRSLYFRHAPEKQMTFLELFDSASPVECYRRSESVVPQQALALANSPLVQGQSRVLARKLCAANADEANFVTAAFETLLSRSATPAERETCVQFLKEQTELYATRKLTPTAGTPSGVAPSMDPKSRARESLVHVLMNHNDFVTVR